MIIEYNVECFERTLVIKCPNKYAESIREILQILEISYFAWHSPEDIEDPEEREWVENDACCEEYMMSKVQEIYHECEEWDSFYYGNNEEEIEEDNEKHKREHNWNIHWLNSTLDQLYGRKEEFKPFEKLGNEAYYTLIDCIQKLEDLRAQFSNEN